MIIDKDIEVKVTGYNIRTFIDAFPNIEKGDTIEVNQIDGLPLRSTLEVECLCSNDGCEETYFRKRRNIHTETTYCSDECRGESIRRNNSESRKKYLVDSLRKRISQGESIRYNDIKKDAPSLIHAITKYYSLREILEELGLSEEELVSEYGMTRNINPRTLSKDEILERLLYLKSIGRLTTSAMRTEFNDFRLEVSIKRTYGSVEECFVQLGLDRDIYSAEPLIMMGRLLESLFRDVLDELGVSYTYQKVLSNNKIPDFYLCKEKVILDTKLSSWTTSIPEDIENYSQYCKKLIFVYLRRGSFLPDYGDNVHLVSIYSYIDRLSSEKRESFLLRINKILSYHPQP